MAEIRRQFVNGAFGQIHLRIAKPSISNAASHCGFNPLYCLHMSPKSGRSFENFMRIAGDNRVIVAHDYPGYGESAPPPADPHVTIEDYARSTWHVAKLLGHKRIDMLGWHTGSLVAAAAIRQKPGQVGSIVMISAPIFSLAELAEFDRLYSPLPLNEDGSRFRIMWERIKQHRGPGMTLEMMATSLAENLRGGEAYEWGHRAAFAHGEAFRRNLRAIRNRVTIINPRDDLYEHTKRARALLVNGNFIDAPQWGHGFMDAFTEEAAETILGSL